MSSRSADLAARLLEQHGAAIRRYLRRLVNDYAVVDDLIQEVYLRIVRAADQYEPRGRDQAWVFRIARNVFLDYQKNQSRRHETIGVPTESGTAAVQMMHLDLKTALGKLNSVDRHAFLLSELGGLRYDEIAGILDLTTAAVRSRIYRARVELRAVLMPPPVAHCSHRGSSADD
jgi:RNA polymerase sigma factor (sigma-70 family)